MTEEKFKWILINNERTEYKIGDRGTVLSFKNKKHECVKLKPHLLRNGYTCVCLYHDDKIYWKYIHRLVGYAFLDVPEKYLDLGLTKDDLEINHIRGDFEGKSFNHVENLEWVTSTDNKYHAYRTGLKKDGENIPTSVYTNEQIEKVCQLLQENILGNRDIWKKTGVNVNTIQSILAGTEWKSISSKYDFSKHKKQKNPYDTIQIQKAIDLLKTTQLSFKEIGDLSDMTRNSVWYLNRKYNIR